MIPALPTLQTTRNLRRGRPSSKARRWSVLMDYSLAPTGKTLLDSPQIVEALKQGMLVGTADSPAFRDAPIFLKEELTFPYRYGLDFTARAAASGREGTGLRGRVQRSAEDNARNHGAATYLAHEKLEPLKLIDMDKDFKDYDAFDIGAMGEFDVDVLVEQYAGGKKRRRSIRRGAADTTSPGQVRQGVTSRRRSACSTFRDGRVAAKAAEFAAVYAKSLAQALSEAPETGSGWQSCGRCASGRFLAHVTRKPCLADRRGNGADRGSRRRRS